MSIKTRVDYNVIDHFARNFNEREAREELICLLKDEPAILCKNQNDEDIELHVSEDNMIARVYQKNGFVRVDEYDKNGYFASQTFEGRWN